MKVKPHYDDEELEILQAWEAGALKPVSDMPQQIKAHRVAAEASFMDRRAALAMTVQGL